MEDQIQALINALKADTSLQERLKAATNFDEVVAIAAEARFVVTKAEVLQAQAQSVELSDRELEDVIGGSVTLHGEEQEIANTLLIGVDGIRRCL